MPQMPVTNAAAAASAPNVSQGLSGNMIVDWLVGQMGVDPSKIDRSKMKLGLRNILDAIEPAIATPANVDAAIIASIENLVDKWIDGLKLIQPVTPPATPGTPFIVGAGSQKFLDFFRPTFTEQQVKDEIIKKGGDPKKFSPFLLLILQWAPTLVQMITMIVNFLNKPTPVVPPVPPAAG